MARSAQTYQLISVDYKKYISVLEGIQDTNKRKYPLAVHIDTSNTNNPSGKIKIHFVNGFRGNVVEIVFIEFDIKLQRCYIIGSPDARIELVKELNKLLDDDPELDIIRDIKLDGRSIYVDMFNIITKIDPDHFIKNLKAIFDDTSGFNTPLDKHNVDEIQFGFVKGYCVSNHKKAFDYIQNAIEIRIKFAVWTLGKFYRVKKINDIRSSLKFDVTSSYAFRFYWTYPTQELLSVMKALDIDQNRYISS